MIRPAQQSDAAEICDLWNGMIRETLHTFTTLEKTIPDVAALITERRKAFFVEQDASGIAGFVTFGPFRAGPGYAHTAEHSILMQPHATGGGGAARLLGHAEVAAHAQGIRVMVAGISAENARALAFHRKQGYAEVGRMPQVGFKAGRWLDLVLMQKNLARDAQSH